MIKKTCLTIAFVFAIAFSQAQTLTQIALPESCTMLSYNENDTIAVVATAAKNIYYRYKHQTTWTQISEPFDVIYHISVYNTNIYVMATATNDINQSGVLVSSDFGVTWIQKFSESFLVNHLIAYPLLFASDDNSFSIWNGSQLKNCNYFSSVVTDISPSFGLIRPHKIQYWNGNLFYYSYNHDNLGVIIGGEVLYSSTFSIWNSNGGPVGLQQGVAYEKGNQQLYVDRGTGKFHTSITGGWPYNDYTFNSGSDYTSLFDVICGYGNFYVIKNQNEIYFSNNGTTWSHFYNSTVSQGTALEVLPNGNLLYNCGAMLEYNPITNTFSPFMSGIHEAFISQASINSNNDVLMITDNVKYYKPGNQNIWKMLFGLNNTDALHISDNGILYFNSYTQPIIMSNNGGNSFAFSSQMFSPFNAMIFNSDSMLALDLTTTSMSFNGGSVFNPVSSPAYTNSVDYIFPVASGRNRQQQVLNVRYSNFDEQLFSTTDFGNSWTTLPFTQYLGLNYGTAYAIDSAIYAIQVNDMATDTIFEITPTGYQSINTFVNNATTQIANKNIWAEGGQFFIQQITFDSTQTNFQIYKANTPTSSFSQLYSLPLPNFGNVSTYNFSNCKGKKLFWPTFDKLYLFEDNSVFPSQVASGQVYFDNNNNNVLDAGELPTHSMLIQNTAGKISVTNPTGAFNFTPDFNGDAISVVTPAYHTSNPSQHTINAGDVGKDFALHIIPNINDLFIHTAHAQPYRSGFFTNTLLSYSNNGTTVQNPVITYVKDADIFYSSFTPSPSFVSGDTAVWNLPAISIGQSGAVLIEEYTDPSVIIGTDVVTYTSIVPSINDSTPQNNTDSTHSLVVMSFDPNYKEVQPAIYTAANIQNNDAIIYTIHFQNTGNYPAFYVTVTDTLSILLDASTFEMIATSHVNYTTQIGLDNVLRVSFIGINLPDSTTDPIASQGYIIFKIKPISNWSAGQPIFNTANIYFDFNAPVITNTVTCSQTTGITENNSSPTVFIYPNPVISNHFFLSNNFQHAKVRVFNTIGQCVYAHDDFNGNQLALPASLQNGVYALTVSTKTTSNTFKMVLKKD